MARFNRWNGVYPPCTADCEECSRPYIKIDDDHRYCDPCTGDQRDAETLRALLSGRAMWYETDASRRDPVRQARRRNKLLADAMEARRRRAEVYWRSKNVKRAGELREICLRCGKEFFLQPDQRYDWCPSCIAKTSPPEPEPEPARFGECRDCKTSILLNHDPITGLDPIRTDGRCGLCGDLHDREMLPQIVDLGSYPFQMTRVYDPARDEYVTRFQAVTTGKSFTLADREKLTGKQILTAARKRPHLTKVMTGIAAFDFLMAGINVVTGIVTHSLFSFIAATALVGFALLTLKSNKK